jgi:hypothetical protein
MVSLVCNEDVRMRRLGPGQGPGEFYWRGRSYRVSVTEEGRSVIRRRSGALLRTQLYRVRTTTGMRCWLSYDEIRRLWRLERLLPGLGGSNERGDALV